MDFYPELPIVTSRLTLRPFTDADVEAVLEYRGREDVAQYLFDPPFTAEMCALAVEQRASQLGWNEEGEKLVLAVELRDEGTLIGEISIILRAQDARQGEIGWIFHPEHQGRGYATEAARELLCLAFDEAQLHRVFARCDVRNKSSWRLMERLGMRREAHFREHAIFKGEWDEEFIYAVLKSEWNHRR